MKTIRWVGGVALLASATFVTVLLANPAAAFVWSRHLDAKALTSGQKSALANNVIKCAAPGIPVVALKDWRCALTHPEDGADVWVCAGSGSVTMGADAYLRALVAGTVGPYESRSGDEVTVPARVGDIKIEGACLSAMDAWIASVWPGFGAATLQGYYVARNPRVAGEVDAEADGLVTGTAVEALDAGVGTVSGPAAVGEVVEP